MATARRATPSAIVAGGVPHDRHVRTHGSASADSVADDSIRASRPPAGRPSASAGSTRYAGPENPVLGSRPHATATTATSTAPSAISGTAPRTEAATAVPRPASPVPRRAARATPGASRPSAATAATSAAATASVSETPIAASTPGATGLRETHEVPRSPVSTPPSQPSAPPTGFVGRSSSARRASSVAGSTPRSG